MAQILVRRLEAEVADRLKRRAKRHRRSLEEEVRHILRDAAKDESRDGRALGSRIARRFKTVGLPRDLPELRQPAQAAGFDE
jgi:plasmid stability protein